MQNLKVESYVLFGGLRTSARDTASQITPGDCSPERREETGYIVFFTTEDQEVRTSKGYCSLKKTRHLKLGNLVLSYVWARARVWAH